MIDVLLPFYGDPELLQQAVSSVLAQTDPRWRLHVVDDCYPDPEGAAWVAAIADPRIRFDRNETNLGVSANFARCLASSEADHVMFLGGDDVMGNNYVADVHAAIDLHPRAAVIQPRVRVIDGAGTATRTTADRIKGVLAPRRALDGQALVLSGESLARSLMHGDWLYFPAITWRRELIAGPSFRTDMDTVLDLALLMDLVLDGHEFVILDDDGFCYRRHGASASSITARTARRFDEEAQLYSEMASACSVRGWTRAARAASLVPTALRARDNATARALLRHAAGRLSG
jgi:glycosyltransferase involved in cell wall biosynthesis